MTPPFGKNISYTDTDKRPGGTPSRVHMHAYAPPIFEHVLRQAATQSNLSNAHGQLSARTLFNLSWFETSRWAVGRAFGHSMKTKSAGT